MSSHDGAVGRDMSQLGMQGVVQNGVQCTREKEWST